LVDRIDQVFEEALCPPSPEWEQEIREAASDNGREGTGAAEAPETSDETEPATREEEEVAA
jgi:hypothetical protein